MDGPSLEDALARAGSAVELLRNAQAPPHVFPVAPEFSNWRSEQRSWRESCALLDQSHHMTDLFVSGPDALRLFRDLGVNSFASFEPGRAKQFVAVNEDGSLIGDAILLHLAPERFDLVGHPMAIDWVQFNLETGGYDATAERDDNSLVRRDRPPKLYRYELQGPTALAIVEKLIGGPVPEIRFFGMGTLTIAGIDVRALRHGMAGQPGFELFGPWAHGERVREAILATGAEFGLTPVGAKGYSTANLESGWVPSPVPAIFTGAALKAYRQWLPAARAGSLGGSLDSRDIRDYYVTPYDLGYGRAVAFDHEFVGREALEEMAADPPRTKVTLVWDADDVTAAIGTLFQPREKAKYFELPKSRYALYQADAVRADGVVVGSRTTAATSRTSTRSSRSRASTTSTANPVPRSPSSGASGRTRASRQSSRTCRSRSAPRSHPRRTRSSRAARIAPNASRPSASPTRTRAVRPSRTGPG